MFNFVLCDDNYTVVDKLGRMLEAIFVKNNISAYVGLKTTRAGEVLSYIRTNSANVFIFDIELKSHMSGLELAKKVRNLNNSAYIIFSTAHLEYMLLAYKVKTFDYLPKPITLERLEETILRLIDDITNIPKKFIMLGGKNMVNQDSVYYIKREGMKLIFHTKSQNYAIYSSFNKIQHCLPENFMRCHKSYIANIEKVSTIGTNNIILFDGKESCSIGPKYKDTILEVLKNEYSSNNLVSSY